MPPCTLQEYTDPYPLQATTYTPCFEILLPPPKIESRETIRQSISYGQDELWTMKKLVDETSRVSAVIDWGDAVIGEPALDDAGLLAWLGRAFLTETLERAGISWNEGDITRAHFFAVTAALHSIALGRQMHKPGWVRSGEVALSHAGITVPQIRF